MGLSSLWNRALKNEKNKQKLKTPSNANPDQELACEGIDGDPLSEKLPQRLNAPNEQVIQGVSGCSIVLGPQRLGPSRDRKYGSGYGTMGAQYCGAIDICAGHNMYDVARGRVKEDIPTNPDVMRDASRLYIGSVCNIDDDFGIPGGWTGKPNAKSAVAAMGDSVRFVGREGVKICTSLQPRNSAGKPLFSVAPIELIPGYSEDRDMIEPIVKGKKMLRAINKLVTRINAIGAELNNFVIAQTSFNAQIMGHQHFNPTQIAIGQGANGKYNSFFDGKVFPDINLWMSGAKVLTQGGMCLKGTLFNRAVTEMIAASLVEPYSADQITSRHVFSG